MYLYNKIKTWHFLHEKPVIMNVYNFKFWPFKKFKNQYDSAMLNVYEARDWTDYYIMAYIHVPIIIFCARREMYGKKS